MASRRPRPRPSRSGGNRGRPRFSGPSPNTVRLTAFGQALESTTAAFGTLQTQLANVGARLQAAFAQPPAVKQWATQLAVGRSRQPTPAAPGVAPIAAPIAPAWQPTPAAPGQLAKKTAAEILAQLASASGAFGADDPTIGENVAKGAEMGVGSMAAQAGVRKVGAWWTGKAAAGAAGSAVAGGIARAATGTAVAGSMASAATGNAVAGGMTAAATGTAALGTAAGTASTALAGLAATLGAVLLPLAAIAAAAGVVYVAIFKWQDLPIWAKALLIAFAPIVIVIRAIALGFRAAGAAVSAITAPFRLAAAGANAIVGAIRAIPGAVAAAIAGLPRLAVAVSTAAVDAAKRVAAGTAAALQALTSRVAGAARGAVVAATAAVQGLSTGLQTAGKWTAYLGAGLVAAGGAIVGPAKMAAAAYAELGQSIEDTARQYQVSHQHASALALASQLTGRSIEDLAELLPEGSAAAATFAGEARRLGLAMDVGAAAGAVALTRATDRLKTSTAGLWATLGSAVAPAIQDVTDLMASAIQTATRWVSEHKPLIATAFSIASKVALAGTAIAALGGALSGVGAVITPFTAAVAAVAAGLAVLELRTGAGRGLWAAYGESVQRVWGVVLDYGGRIVAYTKSVMGGVTDAIRGGNLELAVQIAWTGAQLAWVNALSTLSSITDGTLGGILASLASGNWSAAAEAAISGVQIAWLKGVGQLKGVWLSLQDVWGTLRTRADTIWTDVVNAADAAFVRMLDLADPWWLAFQSGFERLRGNVTTWVTATVAGVQTLASVLLGFARGFVTAILGPMALVPKLAGMAAKALAGLTAGEGALQKLAGGSTADVIRQAGPATGPAGAQAAGPSGQELLARARAERRAADLAARQAERERASYGRGQQWTADQSERAAAAAQEEAARAVQIAALERRITELRNQGNAAAEEKAAQLAQQLAAAKDEAARAAEEARLRGDKLDKTTTETKYSKLASAASQTPMGVGTSSSAVAMLMFGGGGGGGSDQVLKDQLREQREQTRLAKEAKLWQEKALRLLGPTRVS